jgi:hypothetical protein
VTGGDTELMDMSGGMTELTGGRRFAVLICPGRRAGGVGFEIFGAAAADDDDGADDSDTDAARLGAAMSGGGPRSNATFSLFSSDGGRNDCNLGGPPRKDDMLGGANRGRSLRRGMAGTGTELTTTFCDVATGNTFTSTSSSLARES